MTDYRSATRIALVARLKAHTGVTGLIPKPSIFAQTVPANQSFPFSRIGSIIESPFLATCLNSSAFRVTVQGFTRDVTDAGGRTITQAEDNADRIAAAFKDALDGHTIPVTIGGTIFRIRVQWVQTTTTIDGAEASAWMATSTFIAEVAG